MKIPTKCPVMHFGKGMSLFAFYDKLKLSICLCTATMTMALVICFIFNIIIIFTLPSHLSPDPHLSFVVLGKLWMKTPSPSLIFVCSFMVMSLGTRGWVGHRVSAVAEMCAVLTFDSQKELLLSSESHKAKLFCLSCVDCLAFVGGKPAESWQDQE